MGIDRILVRKEAVSAALTGEVLAVLPSVPVQQVADYRDAGPLSPRTLYLDIKPGPFLKPFPDSGERASRGEISGGKIKTGTESLPNWRTAARRLNPKRQRCLLPDFITPGGANRPKQRMDSVREESSSRYRKQKVRSSKSTSARDRFFRIGLYIGGWSGG